MIWIVTLVTEMVPVGLAPRAGVDRSTGVPAREACLEGRAGQVGPEDREGPVLLNPLSGPTRVPLDPCPTGGLSPSTGHPCPPRTVTGPSTGHTNPTSYTRQDPSCQRALPLLAHSASMGMIEVWVRIGAVTCSHPIMAAVLGSLPSTSLGSLPSTSPLRGSRHCPLRVYGNPLLSTPQKGGLLRV